MRGLSGHQDEVPCTLGWWNPITELADGTGEAIPSLPAHHTVAQELLGPKTSKNTYEWGRWCGLLVRQDGPRSSRVQLLPARGKPVGLVLTHGHRNTYLSSSFCLSLYPAESGQLTSFLELYHQLLNEK